SGGRLLGGAQDRLFWRTEGIGHNPEHDQRPCSTARDQHQDQENDNETLHTTSRRYIGNGRTRARKVYSKVAMRGTRLRLPRRDHNTRLRVVILGGKGE